MKRKISIWMCLVLLVAFMIGCGGRYNLPPHQEQAVYRAVSIAVPGATNISIQAYGSQENVRLVISAHLLSNELYSSTDPRVRGQYYNHALLTATAQSRCAQIIKSVLEEAKVPNVNNIQVNVTHGVIVKTTYVGSYSSSTSTNNRSMTLMTVEVNVKT